MTIMPAAQSFAARHSSPGSAATALRTRKRHFRKLSMRWGVKCSLIPEGRCDGNAQSHGIPHTRPSRRCCRTGAFYGTLCNG
jgi:hypothetical protein